MELDPAQYERIAPLLPVQRGNVNLANLQVLNALLYMAGRGCKWRALPQLYGPWHTVYMRLNRRSKRGVLEQVWALAAASLDSTIIKLHPDAEGRRTRGGRRRSGARAAAGRPSCTCSRGTIAAH